MIERRDPSSVAIAGGSQDDIARFIENDFLIRSGMCPNGHGLMAWDGELQECKTCSFVCNTRPELSSQ